jgi:signal transduction histidine kinase
MTSETAVDALARKIVLSLAIVALLVLGSQALVQPCLVRLTTDATLLNAAGRQRMLCQRLAKSTRALGQQGVRDGAALAELNTILSRWSASHERLTRGDAGARVGRAVREGLAALGPHFIAMRDAAGRVIAAGGDGPTDDRVRDGLAVILDHEGDYLRGLDRVVMLSEDEVRGRVEALRRVGWALTGLTLAGLAATGLLIIRPAARLLRCQVAELERARIELEDRVRQCARQGEDADAQRRALLEQLSHAGRTSAVGEAASSLAHELNQPLGAIANYAEGCLAALDAPEPPLDEVREALHRLLAATMRSGRIIAQVRRFVTRHEPGDEPFEPNQVVNDALEILGTGARAEGPTFQLDLAPGLPCLHGDPVQIQQVLVNLIRNAIDALSPSETPAPTVVIWTRRSESEAVEFGVSDNGEGIPAGRIPQIFDAYFSTRAGGMGMGLAICRTIVEAHGGRFFVESEPRVRTTFRFQLPTAPPDHERADGSHCG